MSSDPFFVVRDFDKSEVQKSIMHLEQLYDSWTKLESARKANRPYNSDQLQWTAGEIKSSIKTVEWDLQDLEETIRIVEANPQKFKLDYGEVNRRKAFVTDAKAKMDRILKIVNEGAKSEQTRKQREELSDNPLMSSNSGPKDNSRFESDTNDIIQSEQRQQVMIMEQQDQQMDKVHSTVVNLKNIAVTMGNELDDQQQLLEELDTKVESSGNRLQNAMSRIGKIIQSDKGISGSSLSFGGYRKHEIYVGLSNSVIYCFNNNQVIAKLSGHKAYRVNHLSCHPTRPLLISSSAIDVVLWDTDQWIKKRVLSGAKDFGVHQASFSSAGDLMIAMFKNASLLVWNTDTLEPIWRINLASKHVDHNLLEIERPFSMSHDGVYLAAASTISGNSVFVWNVATKLLIHEIIIPSLEDGDSVKMVKFCGNTHDISVLTLQGYVYFIETIEGKLLTRMSSKNLVTSIDFSSDANTMVSIMKTPSEIKLWDVNLIFNPQPETDNNSKHDQTVNDEELKDNPSEGQKVKVTRVETLKVPKQYAISGKDVQKLVELSPNETLNIKRLREFLKHFGEFPEKFRILIWRFALQLPENRESFEALSRKKIHPSLRLFRQRFPLKSERLGREMETIISNLIYWSPVFENLDYLPSMVFPFARAFKSDVFSCFEALVTIFTNWCELWWEFYPNPPIQILDMVEDLLKFHDCRLLRHFKDCGITSQIYAWLPLSSAFSDVLSRGDWLVAWDNIILNDCDYIYYFLIAFLKTFRAPLFQICKQSDFKFFFTRNVHTNISKIVQLAYKLKQTTPKDIEPLRKKFQPIVKGHYPIFNRYPEYIVNYQKKLRERIRLEEEEYVRRKKVSAEISQFAEELKKENKALKNVETQKSEALEKWWDRILEEEGRHLEQRMALESLENEKRMSAIKELDKSEKDRVFTKRLNSEKDKLVLSKARRAELINKGMGEEIKGLEEESRILEETWLRKSGKAKESGPLRADRGLG